MNPHLDRLPEKCEKPPLKDQNEIVAKDGSSRTRAKHNEYMRRWRAKHREQDRKYARDSKRRCRERDPYKEWTYMRRYHLKRSFGLTASQFEEMLAKQRGKCAVCRCPHKEENKKRLQVDHCHKTKKIRGLLCYNCNNLLGKAKDDIKILRKLIEYLESYH